MKNGSKSGLKNFTWIKAGFEVRTKVLKFYSLDSLRRILSEIFRHESYPFERKRFKNFLSV